MKISSFALLYVAWLLLGHLNPIAAQCYDQDYAKISIVKYKNESYYVVYMRRDGERIKAKYFAAKDSYGRNVNQRYQEWKRNNPNVVLVSSGTYMDQYDNPQGLTIDNGILVNQTLIHDKMDALVVVYATGGIAVSDLKQADLTVSGIPRKLNLRGNGNDLDDFIEWAKAQEATVFQTHLLVYKNEVKINPSNSSRDSRERRFLAVGKDETGQISHAIVHCPVYSTIYDGTVKVLDFLNNNKGMDVIFMINLDTGAQDCFELHNADCSVNSTIKGPLELSKAVNLLVYYFK